MVEFLHPAQLTSLPVAIVSDMPLSRPNSQLGRNPRPCSRAQPAALKNQEP